MNNMSALLEAVGITKVYPNGVVANKDINFSLVEGEIHALAGENGAGKSTLMKILFGMERPSTGELRLNGKPVKLSSPLDAISKGLGMVHQHFMLVPSFSVAQNIILGLEPKKRLGIDYKEALRKVEELSNKYNFKLDPNEKVENLSVGKRQKIEILKALYRGAKILILDEPTAVLTPSETDELFIQLKKLKETGLTIVFISHKLNEVKGFCDRITIMRGGRDMGVYQVADISEREISRLMVGRDVVLKYEKPEIKTNEKILEISSLVYKGEGGKNILSDISLSVKRGQILGVAGVDGNGQNDLVRAIMGEHKINDGSIKICKKEVVGNSVKEIRALGVGYIPEDRMTDGAALEASINDNLIANRYNTSEVSAKNILNGKKIAALTKKLIDAYYILCKNGLQNINMLSGGNMQKVVVARECSTNPNLLIAEQPTRGVDVGSAEFIHQNILKLRENSAAILLISADLNEVLELSDHLVVMYEGEIAAYFENPSEISEEKLGLYMLGIEKQSKEEIRRAV